MTDAFVPVVEDSTFSTSPSLLQRAKMLDRQAWRRLVRLYTPLVYRWCRWSGVSPADAEDVGQEVFEAVARKLSDFHHDRAGDTFRGWLRTITRNKIRDLGRVKRRADAQPIRDWCSEVVWTVTKEGSSDSSLSSMDLEKRILYERAIAILEGEFEERTWQAFWLMTIEERCAADVAIALGMTQNAVHLAKARVLRRLREEFAALLDFDGS